MSPGPEASRVEVEGFVSASRTSAASGQRPGGRCPYRNVRKRRAESLRDGIKVEVKGRVAQGVIVASKVGFEEAPAVSIEGVADAVDAAAGTLVVGGQLIVANATTQFEDRSSAAEPNFGLAKVKPGDRVSVRAVQGAAGLTATRIQRLERGTPPAQAPVRVTGTVASFVSTADFWVAGQRVNAASAEFVEGGASMLRDGVRVTVDGVPNGAFLVATTVTFDGDDAGVRPSVEIEGTISEFTSPASFRVAGRRVDATGATFVNGTIGMLANGLRVEVGACRTARRS